MTGLVMAIALMASGAYIGMFVNRRSHEHWISRKMPLESLNAPPPRVVEQHQLGGVWDDFDH